MNIQGCQRMYTQIQFFPFLKCVYVFWHPLYVCIYVCTYIYVYFVDFIYNLYICRTSPVPSSGGITVFM